jgi:hypothetical protein
MDAVALKQRAMPAACRACRVLRHLAPQNHDCWAPLEVAADFSKKKALNIRRWRKLNNRWKKQ